MLSNSQSPFRAFTVAHSRLIDLRYELSDLATSRKDLQARKLAVESGVEHLRTDPAHMARLEGDSFAIQIQTPLISYQYAILKNRIEYCERILDYLKETFFADCPDETILMDADLMAYLDACLDSDGDEFSDTVNSIMGEGTKSSEWLLSISEGFTAMSVSDSIPKLRSLYELPKVSQSIKLDGRKAGTDFSRSLPHKPTE